MQSLILPTNGQHLFSFIQEDYIDQGYQLDKAAQYIQFYQVITIDQNKLTYVAYTSKGEEYDKAVIIKDFETGKKEFHH